MFTLLLASTILLDITVPFVDACSWDNPVWPKDPRSNTPLFRFVIGVDKNARAGYIDASGRVVMPPTFQSFRNYGDDDFFDGIALVQINEQY